MMMNEVRNCEICGAEFTATHYKNVCCSDECKREKVRRLGREFYHSEAGQRYFHSKTKAGEEEAKRLEHQQDKTVWTHDYAERQKAQTLAMLGEIRI